MKKNKNILLALIILMLSAACSLGAKNSVPTNQPAAGNIPVSAAQPTLVPTTIKLPDLGDTNLVEDGGFSFRSIPGYLLEISGGMVSMLAPGADPDTGPVLQIMGWKGDEDRTNENLYDQLKDGSTLLVGPSAAITVAGIPGIIAEISGDNNGTPMQGKAALVMVDSRQQFMLMLGAPQSEWNAVSPYFDAVLASVEFFELNIPVPISNLTPGMYAYTNANVIRDLVVDGEMAYAATLGGMVAWNLTSGYPMQYTPLQGMRHVSASSITLCEIPEKRIIVGTLRGLSYYDPATGLWEEHELIPADNSVHTSKISRLYCDQANNRLLIGYSGLGVLNLRTGEYQRFTEKEGLAWNEVSDIAVVGQDIWLASGYKGIAVISTNQVTTYTAENGMPNERAHAIAAAKDGTLWVGSSGGIMSFKGGQWKMYGSDTPAGLSDINEIEITPDGKIWVATAPLGTGRICQFNPQSSACDVEYKDADFQAILALALDQQDQPLYGTSKGLYAFDGANALPFRTEDLLHANFVDSFAVTPEGSLWVGTDAGIQFLDAADPSYRWTTYTKSQTPGLGGNWASDISLSANDTLWVAVINGEASRYQNGEWTTLSDLYSFNVVTVDAEQRAWFGDDGKGIVVLNSDGSNAMTLTNADGLPSDQVHALLTDANGVIWIGTDSGLAKYQHGQLSIVMDAQDPRLTNKWIRALAIAPDGALIIGTFTGVVRFDGNQAETLIDFLKDGYSDARLTTLAVAPTGRVWIGTDKGLLYSDDSQTWKMLTTADGLMTNFISALVVDIYGAVWVGGGGSNFDGGGILHIVP
jgi:ligand-binding sensor domain-containing protein